MSTNSTTNKLAFSLAPSKKKRKTAPTLGVEASADFQTDDNEQRQKKERLERNEPLVIPLQAADKLTLLERKLAKNKKQQSEDDLAAEALAQSAANHFSGKETTKNGTNFSAVGDLVISSGDNTNLVTEKGVKDGDKQQYQKDLEALPDEADADAYDRVPIGEFGAALLRGMGWTGESSTAAAAVAPSMRPHRLGLGATPKLPPPPTSNNKIRTADQVKRDERLEQQHAGFEKQRLERIQQDKQRTMQLGSLVYVGGARAKVLKLAGVPGLNRVLVQMEGERTKTSIKKGDMTLIERSDLERRAFRDVELEEEPKPQVPSDDKRDRNSDDRQRRSDDRRRDDRHRDDDRRRDDRSRDDRRRDDRRDDRREDSKKRKRRDDDSRNDKRKEDMSWVIPNIRVRVITKKLGSKQYKEKGVVLDVVAGGATLQMSHDGQMLDRCPERYLETALPKVGGNAIVLVGKSKFAKGKLLERDSRSGKGVIQVFEDMSVLKLSLDDMAEWVGPLDDDMME